MPKKFFRRSGPDKLSNVSLLTPNGILISHSTGREALSCDKKPTKPEPATLEALSSTDHNEIKRTFSFRNLTYLSTSF